MQMIALRGGALVAAGSVVLFVAGGGCATGDPGDYIPLGDDASTDATSSGSSGSSGSSSSSGSSGGHDSSTSSGSSGGSSSSGSGSSSGAGDDSGATGDDGGGDDGGGPPPDGGMVSCPATNTCATSMSLGTFAGDESGSTLMATGTTSQWLVVDATEQDSSPLAVPMKLTATLTSPADSNFDLYAYLGTSTMQQCMMVKAQSTNGTGQADTVSFEWGELGTLANGVDDSALVTLEVRYVSGPCTSGDTWSLSAHGH